MTATHKAKEAAQNAKGKVKETTGRMTANPRRETEGVADQASAHVRHAAEKAKESAKHGAQAAKGAVKSGVGKATGKPTLTAKGKADKAAAGLKEKMNK